MSGNTQLGLLTGAVLGGAYEVTGIIGEGGMGAVYEANHLRLNKRVAIKVMARELASNEEALARFRREAEVTSRLGHPHLVGVTDFGTTDSGEPYLVMEYLDGEDLDHRIRRHGQLPLETAVGITRQVASALAAAHEEGIVHRDLKPANIFLVKVKGEADFVKVLDFGISKIKASRTKLTRASAVMGTPEYMSPEQATGLVDEIDHHADQWALGCIAWEMLAGRAPFIADDMAALFYQVINMDPHPLSKRAPGLPPDVEPVLRRALSKQPQGRYPSIRDFARAFEAAAMGVARDLTPAPVVVSSAAMVKEKVEQAPRSPSVKSARSSPQTLTDVLGRLRLKKAYLIGIALVVVIAVVGVLASAFSKPKQDVVRPSPPAVAPKSPEVVALPSAPAPQVPAPNPEPQVPAATKTKTPKTGQPGTQTKPASPATDKVAGAGRKPAWVDPWATSSSPAPAKSAEPKRGPSSSSSSPSASPAPTKPAEHKPSKARSRGTLVEEL